MKTRKRTKNWSARRNLSMVAVTHYTSVLNESKNICYFAHSAGNFSGYTLCSVSLLTAAAISVDRLLALLLGLRYRQLVTLRRTCIIAFGFWILSIVGSLCVIIKYMMFRTMLLKDNRAKQFVHWILLDTERQCTVHCGCREHWLFVICRFASWTLCHLKGAFLHPFTLHGNLRVQYCS